jgi:hypothetical protein
MKFLVVFADEPNQKYEFPINNLILMDWMRGRITTPSVFSGREIAMFGFRFESFFDIPDYAINIGRIEINNLPLDTTEYTKNNSFVTVSYPSETTHTVHFSFNWPNTEQLSYVIYDLQGKAVKSNCIALNGITNYSLDTNELASGTYMIRFTDEKNVSETKKIIIK